MAKHVPQSRFGRALMAGIPVAIVIAGVELLGSAWSVDRGKDDIVLSWMSAQEDTMAHSRPAVRLTGCFGSGCGGWSVSVSLPEHPFGQGMTRFARSLVTGDCTDAGARSRPLATA